MLLGAWPIGGVKHSSIHNPHEKSGKCRFIILCSSYALFLVIGAAIFSVIEAPQLDKYQRELIETKDKFAQRNPCINRAIVFQRLETAVEESFRDEFRDSRRKFLEKNPNVEDDDLENFIAEVLKASSKGISSLRNATSEPNWTFGQALFFSTTVVTTIGYGHVTPLSQTGKLFCLIYALIGIPLTLVLLSAAVERLMTPCNWMLGVLNAKLGHLYQPFNIRILHLSIVIFIVLILFFGIPTALFAYFEEQWSLMDAFYYCFISLTTIGLGDFIPGDGPDIDYRSIYKIGTTCYLIMGLIAIMLTLNVFYDIPQLNLGQLFTESRAATFDGESEKLRSTHNPCYSGPTGFYMPQRDEEIRAVVRIRPHQADSPSPEDSTPLHAEEYGMEK